ncbi:MAG: hypothetical protein LUQ35_02625 [Methanoregula sp.]|nr:hypothetical protein [Methanoregula sp.]
MESNVTLQGLRPSAKTPRLQQDGVTCSPQAEDFVTGHAGASYAPPTSGGGRAGARG